MFLPKMVDGNVDRHDEPDRAAGGLRPRGRAHARGAARRRHRTSCYGQKIFITYGEHDYTENIIHLVLARTPDAPEGVKGISLFVVPKFCRERRRLARRAQRRAVRVDRAQARHPREPDGGARATATTAARSATSIGEENRGLEYMFIMMNLARFSVGMEGVGISERAYQRAVAFARDRVQGKPVGLDRRRTAARSSSIRTSGAC